MLVVEQLQLDHDVGPQFCESLPCIGPAPQNKPAAEKRVIQLSKEFDAKDDDDINLYS